MAKKFRLFWMILVLLCIFILSYTAVILIQNKDLIKNYFLENIDLSSNADDGYSVKFESFNTNSLRKFEFSNFRLLKDNDVIFKTSEITVSTSLLDLIQILLGVKNVPLNFTCIDADVDVVFLQNPFDSNPDKNNNTFIKKISERLCGRFVFKNINANVSFPDYNISINDLNLKMELNGVYDIRDFDFNFESLRAKIEDHLVSCDHFDITFDSFDSIDCLFDSIVYDSYNIENINLNFNYDPMAQSISMNSYEIGLDIDVFGLNSCNFKDCFLKLDLNNDSAFKKISFSSFVSGNHKDENIQDFSFNISFVSDFVSFEDLFKLEQISDVNLNLSNIKCAAFSHESSLWIKTDDLISFTSSFNLSDNVVGNVDYSMDGFDSNIKLYISSLKFSDYQFLYNYIEEYAGSYLDKDTQLDGSVVLKGKLDMNDLNGIISINLIGQNFVLSKNKQTVALSFEANADDNILSIETLAISALGKRLSYSGQINLTNYFPEGNLILRDASSFDEISRFIFNLDDNKLGYSFKASIADNDNFLLDGHVNFSEKNLIVSQTSVKTENYNYDFNLNVDLTNNDVSINSSNLDVNASFDSTGISVNGNIDEFPVFLSNKTKLFLDSNIDFDYLFNSPGFSLDLNNVQITVSDILSVCFNLDINDVKTSLNSLSVNFKEDQFDFDGNLDVLYSSFANLLDFSSRNFEIRSNLHRLNSNNYVRGSFVDDVVSLNLMLELFNQQCILKLLGSLDSGYYAECKFGSIAFNANYNNGILNIDNGEVGLNTLNFQDFVFNIDFIEKKVLGSLKFENYKENYDGIKQQGGVIQLNAQLDSLVIGALNFAGIDAQASFSLSIVDSHLGDDFDFKDTTVDVSFSRSLIELNGDLISGYILPLEQYLNVKVDKEFLIGFEAEGYFNDQFEIHVSNIYFPLRIIDQFINTPIYSTFGGIIEGELLINGNPSDPSFYGMLYCQDFNMGLLYIPEQSLSVKDVVISAVDHKFYIPRTPVVGYSDIDGRYYNGNVSVELTLGALSLDSFDLYLDVPDKPIDLWIPIVIEDSTDLDIRGDVVGTLHFYYKNNQISVDCDIRADNANVDFEFENEPDWLRALYRGQQINCDVKLTSGEDVEFYYPNIENSFINFTVEENNSVDMIYNIDDGNFYVLGGFNINSGRISYVDNDFNITEGNCYFNKNLNGEFEFNIDLLAKIREYDNDGNRMDIFLTLKDSNLENINPRFSSTPSLSENEILQILISNVFPQDNNINVISNFANVALVAARAASSLGYINDVVNLSMNSVVSDALMLDIFTARSPILQNIILESLTPQNDNISLLARYLNGTTIFAGKYFDNNWFARMTLLLRSSTNKEKLNNYGHFLTNDLNLDFEFSLEWDNPFGEFAVFTKPNELSIFDFLDTIGFSVTKRFSF